MGHIAAKNCSSRLQRKGDFGDPMVEEAQELSAEMTVTSLRKCEEFNGDQEEWLQYKERFGYFSR